MAQTGTFALRLTYERLGKEDHDWEHFESNKKAVVKFLNAWGYKVQTAILQSDNSCKITTTYVIPVEIIPTIIRQTGIGKDELTVTEMG